MEPHIKYSGKERHFDRIWEVQRNMKIGGMKCGGMNEINSVQIFRSSPKHSPKQRKPSHYFKSIFSVLTNQYVPNLKNFTHEYGIHESTKHRMVSIWKKTSKLHSHQGTRNSTERITLIDIKRCIPEHQNWRWKHHFEGEKLRVLPLICKLPMPETISHKLKGKFDHKAFKQ